MRYGVFILAALTLLVGGASPTSVPAQDDMKTLYAENQRLKIETESLDRQRTELDRQIDQANKALANLRYVEQENEKWMKTDASR